MEEINTKLDCKRKQIPKQANDKLTVLFPMYLNFIAEQPQQYQKCLKGRIKWKSF